MQQKLCAKSDICVGIYDVYTDMNMVIFSLPVCLINCFDKSSFFVCFCVCVKVV